MSIAIAPALEARIERLAAARGVDANQYVMTLLTEAVAEEEQDPDANFTDEQKAAVHAGITQGLQDFAEGRFRPSPDIAAESRRQESIKQ